MFRGVNPDAAQNPAASPQAASQSAAAHYPQLPLPLPLAWKALVALCIGFFMILLDQTIVAVALTELQRDLGADYGDIIWINSIYLLFFAVPLLVTGRMGDRWGPRNLYLGGMVIFTLASLACGLAPTATALIAARAVQGAGAALLTPQTMAVINRVFPRERRGSALGFWGAVAGLAGLAGPLLGGLIMSIASWHWIFFINVPIGVLSLTLVALWVPRFKPTDRPIDAFSILLSMTAMTLLIYGIQQGTKLGWPWWIIGAIVASLGLIALFLRRQGTALQHGKDPVIPLALFRLRSFSFGNLSIFTMGFAIAGMMIPVMMYLQQVHHFSALTSALYTMPMSVIGVFLAPVVGRLVDTRDPRPLAMGGFTVLALAIVMMVVVMRPGWDPRWIIAAFVIAGFGNSFIWAPNSTITLRDLPMENSGAGSGMYNTTRQTGSVLGVAIMGAVLESQLSQVETLATATGFAAALIPAAVVLLLGAWGAYMGVDR